MTKTSLDTTSKHRGSKTKKEQDSSAGVSDKKPKKISMHEDVPIWQDCCGCEAEPYWAELAVEDSAEETDNMKDQTGHQKD